MKADIQPGVDTFKWESAGIDEFIKEAKKTVDELF